MTNQIEAKHTALYQHYNDGVNDFIISAGKVREADCIATMSKPYGKRAAFIVKACNNHDELVEALRAMYEDYLREISVLPEEVKGGIALKAKSALAKAGG